jgi:hypothetical protein
MTSETHYLLERSAREAVRAIQSSEPKVAGIHQELCLLYTARALRMIAAEKRRIRRTVQPPSSPAR